MPFQGSVDYDETMFGGKGRVSARLGATSKSIVLGILQRNGLVHLFPAQDRSGADIITR